MQAVAEGLQAATIIPESPRNRLATWHIRAGAMAVDILPGVAAVATMALVSFTVPRSDAWWSVSVSVGGTIILLVFVTRSLLPTVTGWSLGRAKADWLPRRHAHRPVQVPANRNNDTFRATAASSYAESPSKSVHSPNTRVLSHRRR
jgi:hypothetical protein